MISGRYCIVMEIKKSQLVPRRIIVGKVQSFGLYNTSLWPKCMTKDYSPDKMQNMHRTSHVPMQLVRIEPIRNKRQVHVWTG